MAETQTFASHRRYYPLFHFFIVPMLLINVILRVVYLWRHAGARMAWWDVAFGVVLLLGALAGRLMTLTVQDRLIRLEETVRMQRILPDDLRGRVGEFSPGQMISLRFCPDDELPELARNILTDKIHSRDEIKKRIKNWRGDSGPRA
jgi:hypothetical protein